jgi:hypothetical protein
MRIDNQGTSGNPSLEAGALVRLCLLTGLGSTKGNGPQQIWWGRMGWLGVSLSVEPGSITKKVSGSAEMLRARDPSQAG